MHLHPNSSNLSASDGLDWKVADNIVQFDDDDTPSYLPEMEVIPNALAPIDDTVQVQSFEDDDWDPLASFATPRQWHLSHSIVDTNLG